MNSRTNLTILLILGLHLHVFAQESSKELTTKYSALEITAKDLQSAEELVDQLVLNEGKASNEPVLSPGVADNSPEYAQRFKKVQDAFGKLTELKIKAFPVLVKHLEDKRQSINFRNHYVANSVGDAWYVEYLFPVARPSEKLLKVRLPTEGSGRLESPQAILGRYSI
jgi:hypothetical protein